MPGGTVSNAALNKSDIDVEGGIVQPLKVLQRALGGNNVQSNAVASQYSAVFNSVCFEGAAGSTPGHSNRIGRSGVKEPIDSKQHHNANYDDRNECSGATEPESLREYFEQPGKTSLASFCVSFVHWLILL